MKVLLRAALIIVLGLSLFVVYIGSARADVYIHTLQGEVFPGKMQQFIKNLEGAKEGDLFTLDIASEGGRLDEAEKTIVAMRETKGTIVCRARSASSAAAFIFMACHYGTVDLAGTLMFHFSHTMDPKTGIISYFRNTPNYIDILDVPTRVHYEHMRTFLINIGVKELLTDIEWNRLNTGENIYITGFEYLRRVNKD